MFDPNLERVLIGHALRFEMGEVRVSSITVIRIISVYVLERFAFSRPINDTCGFIGIAKLELSFRIHMVGTRT